MHSFGIGTTSEHEQMAIDGRLAGVDVADHDEIDMSLLGGAQRATRATAIAAAATTHNGFDLEFRSKVINSGFDLRCHVSSDHCVQFALFRRRSLRSAARRCSFRYLLNKIFLIDEQNATYNKQKTDFGCS